MSPEESLRRRPGTALAATTLAVDVVAGEVVSALKARGIDCILLKGAAVERHLYAAEGEREYRDADLLVDPDSRGAASVVLRDLGFRPIEIPAIDGQERHAETWLRPLDDGVIDLHRTLAWVAAPDDLVWRLLSRATEEMDVGGTSVRALTPEALAVQLALHAVTHADAEQPIEDLDRAMAQWPLGVWQGARAIAEELGALPALRAGLALTRRGDTLIEELGLSHTLAGQIELAAYGPPGALALRRIWSQPWRDRPRLLARQVIPPRAFMHYIAPNSRRGGASLVWAHVRRLAVIGWRAPSVLVALARTRRLG